MKILELRFKNLNSLYGEWLIDFTHPDYIQQGIFALTGPTGSGKTTILDAICLALYGKTPRLGSISKKNNDIMSRQTNSCYAEVVFATQMGKYRIHWAQYRAHHRKDGELQAPKHEISEADTGKIIESKPKKTLEVAILKTGMDFERFTRSILLAQGQFDTFLKAEAKTKSEILEEITGTQLYSDISMLVFERQKEEKIKLQSIKNKISLIPTLNPEEEAELNHHITNNQYILEKNKIEYSQINESISWLKTILNLKEEIDFLKNEKIQFQSEIKAFKTKKNKLEWAKKAQLLENEHFQILNLDLNISQKKNLLNEKSQQLLAQKQELKILLPELELIKNNLANTESEYEKQIKKIAYIRTIDKNILNYQKDMNDIQQQILIQQNELAIFNQELPDKNQAKLLITHKLKKINSYLDSNCQDKYLIRNLTKIEENLDQFNIKEKEKKDYLEQQNNYQIQLSMQDKKIRQVNNDYHINDRKLKQIKVELKNKEEQLSTILNHQPLKIYREQKEQCLKELIQLNRIISFKEERQKLLAGEPCPLCGSTLHPYHKNITLVENHHAEKLKNIQQIIQQAEQMEETISKIQAQKQKYSDIKQQLENNQSKLKHQYALIQQQLNKNEDILQKLEKNLSDIQLSLEHDLHLLNISLTDIKIENLKQELRKKLNDWEKYQQAQNIQSQLFNELDHQILIIQQKIENIQQSIDFLNGQLNKKNSEYQTIVTQRKELFAHKNPDIEEQQLKNNQSKLKMQKTQSENKLHLLTKSINTLQGELNSLQEQIIQDLNQKQEKEQNLLKSIQDFGFKNQEHFLNSLLSKENFNQIIEEEQDILKRENSLNIQLEDRIKKLTKALKKEITTESMESLNLKLTELYQQKETILSLIATQQFQLEENAKAKAKIKKEKDNLSLQEKEFNKWNLLCDLIGSADGKKFRNFAQGLTFESLLINANQQLQKMSDRYLLIQNPQEPLTLDVIDNYQAGELRTVKNLSGGESFLVSLSLALGLSKIASQTLKIDSLFLDEGFGSLDQETLDTALEALATLQQQEGKLIGIISHIPDLQERISTQIKITPIFGGKSQLTGPGIQKLYEIRK